jgi:GNAT superfamily N-acetyltransferase
MSDTVSVRPVRDDDRDDWAVLWRAYLDFYETTVSETVYETTFARLVDPAVGEMGCFLAEMAGRPVGLVHFIQHRHNWRIEDVIYLQDLYADPAIRGKGVGRALIEAVYAEADRRGTPSVYWMTQDFYVEARKLYDRVANLTPFIKYQR